MCTFVFLSVLLRPVSVVLCHATKLFIAAELSKSECIHAVSTCTMQYKGVETFLDVSAFISYEKVIYTYALLVSRRHYPQQPWFASSSFGRYQGIIQSSVATLDQIILSSK